MKLEKILSNLNSLEKNSFLKIIDGIISENPQNAKEVDNILSDSSRDLKNMDNINIARVFNLLEYEYEAFIKSEFNKANSQLDIILDIFSRDGNGIIRQDWFSTLYNKEVSALKKKIKEFNELLEDEKQQGSNQRFRDYTIYKACLKTAYINDNQNNLDPKITQDEQSILITLARQLGLSQEETKLIKYSVLPVKKVEIENLINDLKSIGVIFFSKKNNTIYVSDEMVRIFRRIRGKVIADKYFRRILKSFREPMINMICRKHNIDCKQKYDVKIGAIITEGISIFDVLSEDIFKDGTKTTDKKVVITDLFENSLKISPPIKGSTIEDKIQNLLIHFEHIESDEKVGISFDGYEKLLLDMGESLPNLNNLIKLNFEFQEDSVLNSQFLLDYNIKPRDIIEILTDDELTSFCKLKGIKTRGDIVVNILEAYKDTENLLLENYENIGFRNLAKLKDNNILIKEPDLGIKFEELTKLIFSKLGFNVDEKLRAKLNTAKDKIDIVINLGNNDLILVECKTVKESGYNKFSAVSRQLKSYTSLATKNDFKVIKSLLIAPDFSDDFIKECGLEYELNLSLITASSLIKILNGFKISKLKEFPYNLLMRDVLIQEERVIKAIQK